MKFAKLLDAQVQDAWRQHYLDYRALKSALWDAQNDDIPISVSPRTASFSVARRTLDRDGRDGTTAGEEQFMVKLQQEMAKVVAFAQSTAAALRQELLALMQHSTATNAPHLAERQSAAHQLGDAVLALERFVQLNQVGFMKIIKKHDKAFPAAPLRSFFTQHLATHPWGTDGQPSLWALVSAIFQQLHTAPSTSKSQGAGATSSSNSSSARPLPLLGAEASTSAAHAALAARGLSPRASGELPPVLAGTSSEMLAGDAASVSYKYWVRQEDVSQVMYTILQHLPMLPHDARPVEQTQQRQRASPQTPKADGPVDATLGTESQSHASEAMDGPSAGGTTVHERRSTFADCSTAWRSVYLDNESMELYHNRLYVRPDAATVKLCWSADAQTMPQQVVLQRKVHRQGWKGDPNTKDTIMLPTDKVSGFMDGSYTLWQALQHMLPPSTVRLPIGMQSSMDPSAQQSDAQQQHKQRHQAPEGGEHQHQQPSPDKPGMPGVSGGSSVWDQSLEDLAQMPTCSKQLSLFSELQGLIARKRLRPVLSTAAQRLLFQMPFDPTMSITLETDVLMTSQVWDAPLTPEVWTQLLGEQLEDAASVYRLPYCLLKITTCLPRAAEWPAWLQALINSKLVYEVEDWSKFVHGCAVLMLEQARAVPYWVDDPLIAASSQAFQYEWELLVDGGEASGSEYGLHGPVQQHQQHQQQQQQQQQHGHGSGKGAGQPGVADLRASTQHKRHGSMGSIGEGHAPAGEAHALARLQSSGGASTSQVSAARVVSLGMAGSFIARALSLRQSQQASGSTGQLGRHKATDEFLLQLKKRRRGRRRHGHPAQLLALRDFLHNEDVFMTWLCMAVMLSGSALLLLSFSAIAKINPLSHPEIHIAEAIMLLLLPVSVIMVAYAMGLYLWRSRRLYHPMRYWRVDDSWGPNVMAFIIVVMLWAVLVVSVTDMAILIKKARKHIDPVPYPSPEPFPDPSPFPEASPVPSPGWMSW